MSFLSKIMPSFGKKDVGTLNDRKFWTDITVNHPYPVANGQFMRVTAALRAGRVIAEGLAQMPLYAERHKVDDNGRVIKTRLHGEKVNKLIHDAPNDFMTAFEWIEVMTLHAVFCRAGRSLIVRAPSSGNVVEILPLHPQWVTIEREPDGQVFYEVSAPDYGVIGRFTRDDIIEITSPKWDLLEGLDIARLAGNALGLSESLERRQNQVSGSSRREGAVTTNLQLGQDRIKILKDSWNSTYGPDGTGGAVVLDNGAGFKEFGQTAQESQSVENRKFQIEEIARVFGVFPQMLMHSDKTSTFASADSFFVAHVKYTLGPWMRRWEQSLNRSLFTNMNGVRANFDEKELMRGVMADQAEFWARALGSGGNAPWATPNDAREGLGMNPIEGGDELPTMNAPAAPAAGDNDDGV